MRTDLKQFVGNLADNYDRRRSMLETLVSAQDEDE